MREQSETCFMEADIQSQGSLAAEPVNEFGGWLCFVRVGGVEGKGTC